MANKCQLIMDGSVRAQCTCGNWTWIGLSAEAKKAINDIYRYHLSLTKIKPTKKKSKKSKK